MKPRFFISERLAQDQDLKSDFSVRIFSSRSELEIQTFILAVLGQDQNVKFRFLCENF